MSLPFNLLFHNSRGMGKSTLNDEPYLDASAKDLSELVRHLGLTSAHYVAHGMGGLVLARFNYSYSSDLDPLSVSLICTPSGNLISTFPLSRVVPKNLSPLLKSFSDGLIGSAASLALEFHIIRTLAHLVTRRSGLFIEEDTFRELYENFFSNRAGVVAALDSMIKHGDLISTEFPHIDCPVLLVSGTRDFFVSQLAVARLREALPHTDHISLGGCTHAPMFEQSDVFNRHFAQFIISSHSQNGNLPIAG